MFSSKFTDHVCSFIYAVWENFLAKIIDFTIISKGKCEKQYAIFRRIHVGQYSENAKIMYIKILNLFLHGI